MAALRVLLTIFGAVLALFGTFFALQGAGVIMWPAESFMLAESRWIIYGLAIAAIGIGLIVLARRMGRRG